jgi:hypothetical protein
VRSGLLRRRRRQLLCLRARQGHHDLQRRVV